MRYKVTLQFFYITSTNEISNFVELFYVDSLLNLPKELEEFISEKNWEKVTLREMTVYPVVKKDV